MKTKKNMKKNITIPDSTGPYVGPQTIAALYGFRVTTIYNWAKRSNFSCGQVTEESQNATI